MILQVEKRNDAIVQQIKQADPRLYEALRRSDRIDVPLTENRGFGVSGAVSVGASMFPPMIFWRRTQLHLIQLTFNTVPTGADFIADIKKRATDASILKAPLIYPASFVGVVERAEFGIDTFDRGDILICDITQVGSTVAGSNMSLSMIFNVLE
jgi:hypothetical protein